MTGLSPSYPMLEDVLAIPDHLSDALWRVETARLERRESAGLLVCGMGGSAIGGDLAAAALGDRLTRPLLTVRGAELPSWASAEWTVLCSSYSGGTEETLACFEAAVELGARVIVASTGGALVEAARPADVPVIGLPGLLPAPRTAVAYMLVCAAEVAAAAGVAPSIREEIEAASTPLLGATLSVAGKPSELASKAAEIVPTLVGGTTVVFGAGLTAPVARRWKTQLNENAKMPAFSSELPEADHNELCGWDGIVDAGLQVTAVLLEDAGLSARERRRFELTAAEIEEGGGKAVRVTASGHSPLHRLLWTVMLGDLVSLGLAASRGVDPLPIEAVERFKGSLGTS
jgi:glucose/mannose-6-phosphate isomerase